MFSSLFTGLGRKQIVGNLQKEKLLDIWLGEKFKYARKKLSNSDRTMSPCNKCDRYWNADRREKL